MTVERCFVAALRPDHQVTQLVTDIQSAARRSDKSDPGDRFDVARLEALCTQLERLAWTSSVHRPIAIESAGWEVGPSLLVGRDPSKWPVEMPRQIRHAAHGISNQGLIPVLLVTALSPGMSKPSMALVQPPEPAAVWDSDGLRGRAAVERRFAAQIEEALAEGGDSRRAISPSNVQNSILTETLRRFVEASPGDVRMDVPVEYRDGSKSANRFPLRALVMRAQLPAFDLELKFSLLSIRHTELDSVVHGAWLRNAEISRPRPAAQTDDLVYEISRQQLDTLTLGGSRKIRLLMFQTGLETAVVGFYKGLTHHLLTHPNSVAVQPMYFATGSTKGRKPSPPGTPRRKTNEPRAGGAPAATLQLEHSLFTKGTPWAA